MGRPTVNLLDLASTTDVCEMLGVSRQRVNQIRREDKTFPAPVYNNGQILMWRRQDVRHWGMNQGYIARF